MGRKRTKNLYWEDKHERLFTELSVCDNDYDRNLLILELQAALRSMAAGIISKYFFGLPQSDHRVNIYESITEVVLVADRYKPENGSAFSFCQTCMKNHLLTKFGKPSFNETVYQDALRNQQSIVDEDHDHRWVDNPKDVEIVSVKDKIIDKLLRKSEDIQKEIDKRLKKRKGIELRSYNKTKFVYYQNLSDMLGVMIDELEREFISYERFIINVFEQSDCTRETFVRRIKDLGFSTKYVNGILYDYLGQRQENTNEYYGHKDYKLDDHPPEFYFLQKSRKARKKRFNK